MAVKNESFNVQGLKELDKMLDGLTEDKFRKAALRSAGKDSMKIVLNQAKRDAPILKDNDGKEAIAGQLRDDIKMTTSVNVEPTTKSGKISKSKNAELKVRVKTGKDTEDYALVTEFGRDEYSVIRDQAFGKETKNYKVTIGKIDPRPFMGPALDDNKDIVLKDFSNNLSDSIFTQAKKLGKFNKKRSK